MNLTIPPIRCTEPNCAALGYWQLTSRFHLCPAHRYQGEAT